MSKKVSLTVNGSRFDIELEDAFAQYLIKQMKNDFNTDGNNDAKTLLYAYVRKNAELFKQEEEITAILNNFNLQE
ncbi:hypothetical protein [Sulfurovum sp.]|uniref:hypothetical protein n=1 Tax=Sulfurovum sp. TaxID=1969726 RepID=UPI003562CD13